MAATATPRVTETPRVTATPRPTATPRTNVTLDTSSSRKSDIGSLQSRLIDLGYLSGSVTQRYDGGTEYAVIAFQNRNGLYADGIAGPDTLTRLYSSDARRASQLAATIGVALYEGDDDHDAVRAMQRRLKELGYLSGNVDGSYGSKTTAAVMRFQDVNGLSMTGNADVRTLSALYSSNAIRASESASSGQTANSGNTTAGNSATATPVATLNQGAASDGVRELQTRLKELGYYTGAINGIYDSATTTAVMAFQTSRNLTADGEAGTATLNALYDYNAVVTYTTLRQGNSGTKVRTLQQQLYDLGYYTGAVDGSYGHDTAEAVRAFQSRNGLRVSGIADNETQTVLYSANALEAPVSTATYVTLSPGDSGEDVLEMKDMLLTLGYSPSANSNVYDERTENAVRLFQERNGLTVDGVAGPATLRKLYSDSAVAYE